MQQEHKKLEKDLASEREKCKHLTETVKKLESTSREKDATIQKLTKTIEDKQYAIKMVDDKPKKRESSPKHSVSMVPMSFSTGHTAYWKRLFQNNRGGMFRFLQIESNQFSDKMERDLFVDSKHHFVDLLAKVIQGFEPSTALFVAFQKLLLIKHVIP